MKRSAKILALAVCVVFVLMLIPGCNEAAKTENKCLTEKQWPKVDIKSIEPCPKECPKADAKQCPMTAGKLSQNDMKKARLVSAENLELKTQIEQLQKTVEDLNAKLTKAQQANEQLQKNNEQSMEVMVSSMTAGIEEATAKLQEENKKLKDELDALKAEPKK